MQTKSERKEDLQNRIKWAVRLCCLLLSAAYVHQYIKHMIQAQDFRRGYFATISAIIVAFICNYGLWFTTLPVAKKHRIVGIFILIPSLIISPMIVDNYLGNGPYVV